MMRTKHIRDEFIEMLKAQPFEPFVVVFENGQTATVEHPENVAYDPPNGRRKSSRVHILTKGMTVRGTFDAVTSIIHRDRG